MKKKIYETPQAEALEVNAEGVFCLSGNPESQTEEYGYVEGFSWE